ncbi:MAG: 30S ribosomal protein S27ae [Methanomicrobiales archaeon]|nr:30S ribosomal protein S27ae [Methanomicrobiales archaeon]NYT21187.1 30S ribosomal protein S27ae [Methanomicrobiales archaeon]
MAAKKAKSTAPRRASCYKVEGGKATLARKNCPRCGPGVIMAEHKDRAACGKCGYTEFKK